MTFSNGCILDIIEKANLTDSDIWREYIKHTRIILKCTEKKKGWGLSGSMKLYFPKVDKSHCIGRD